MAPGLEWPKNGHRNGKNGQKMAKIPFRGPFFHFGGHFSAISSLGPFSISFPFSFPFLCRAGFPFCIWPLQSQVYVISLSDCWLWSHAEDWAKLGCFFAYSWKVPACNGIFILTLLFRNFLTYNWNFLTYNFIFYLQLKFFVYMGKVCPINTPTAASKKAQL